MARLLVDGEWYESLSPASMYEGDFERLLMAHAAALYPDFQTVEFKKLVFSDVGNGKPDLALIDRSYRSWWVVEVEMGDHSLSHVERQVETFSTARYAAEEAEYLALRKDDLDYEMLRDMMLGLPPRVLVIVNTPKPAWPAKLARHGAIVGIAEVFRSQLNRTILRVNGEHPEPLGEEVSLCRLDPMLPNMLLVDSPAGLGIRVDQEVEIEFEGAVSSWRRLDVAAQSWLVPVGRFPLPPDVRQVTTVRGAQGRLEFRRAP